LHFKEHVIEAIPFHTSIFEQHKKRLETIKNIMPLRKYRKIVKLSLKFGGTPEYFVFDKQNKKCFFVIENTNEERKKWAEKAKKVIEVITIEK
jgi:hypothetical protein